MDCKLVPYQNIPDAPGKSPEEIRRLGRCFFPFSDHSAELSYGVYDWTSPSFMRVELFKVFVYSGVAGEPLDLASIANEIWTSNWPPFTPHDKDYMHSFLMVPADSEADVKLQLDRLHKKLRVYCDVQNRMLEASFYSMPRTSIYKVPQIFSGQNTLGLDHFAAEFREFPGNAGPVSEPLRMPFQEALKTFFRVGNTITTKCVFSFTEYRDYAMKYANGVLLVVNPLPGAVIWETASYVTDLSDDPKKNEYCFPPGSKFLIQSVHQDTICNKDVWVFTMVVKK